jgi:hypothetical protein
MIGNGESKQCKEGYCARIKVIKTAKFRIQAKYKNCPVPTPLGRMRASRRH